MLLLGASIIKLPNWRAVALGTNVSVCAARMVAMPLLALGMWIMLKKTVQFSKAKTPAYALPSH